MKKGSKKTKGLRKTTVPNVVGLTRVQAQQAILNAGFQYSESSEATSDSSLDGKIKSQTQSSSLLLFLGNTVNVTYNSYVAPPNFAPDFSPYRQIYASYCNSSNQAVGMGAVCDRTYGGTTYADCCSYWRNIENPAKNWSCGEVSQPAANCTVPVDPGFGSLDFNPPPPPPPPDPPGLDFGGLDFSGLDFGGIGGGGDTMKSIGVNTMVRTPEGLVMAEELQVGDVLYSANIEGFPYDHAEGVTEAAIAWSSENPGIEIVETNIVDVQRRISHKAVAINNDIFSESHYILVKSEGLTRLKISTDVVDTDLVYSYDFKQWDPIFLLESIDADFEVISIDCEPYDMFFTENMLTHDSKPI
jgi:hypothetical protein